MYSRRRSTPHGEHRPVMLAEILRLFNLQPGHVVVDCTVGWGGHAAEFLKAVGPEGKLIGLDLDAENLTNARPRLDAIGLPFDLHHLNFAGIGQALNASGVEHANSLLADLGFSSMQVDDPARGFSYRREGPLDMRLDRSRGKTAAQILATIPEDELAHLLSELADEPRAGAIAQAIAAARKVAPLTTTTELSNLLMEVAGVKNWRLQPQRGVWEIHPAARTFQALRIIVNRELANLEHLLRVLPYVLKPGGVAAIISFHSGEDRLVKTAFREGLRRGEYSEIAEEPVRASYTEKGLNPRSRSAKMRWARRGEPGA
ncbi:MAG TPA: 16S rRNA (cytosine(1402)-N(4))-methyltransferase RsmH [Gemmataceae bacterium]|nr:16S rRNA (cytosine(1402)-N(4))-methyltransferase RsmH [Gemmataceae bacterium]